MTKTCKQNRVVIFAHYDKDSIIDDYVIHYLKELKKEADKIIFVSDCNLDKTETQKIEDLVSDCLAKSHGEYDFGSYKRGLEIFYEKYFNETEELIICNDSCFGGIFPFKEVFDEAGSSNSDYWGMSLVYENKPNLMHFQSFFLAFSKKIFEKGYFKEFFENIHKLENKNFIISEYEIGLSKMLFKHSKNYYAAYSIGKLNRYQEENEVLIKQELKEIYKNYSVLINFNKKSGCFFFDDWIYILLKMKCPFLKKTCWKINRPIAYNFCETISKNSNFDKNLIENYYKRMGFKDRPILLRLLLSVKNRILQLIEKLVCGLISSKNLRIRVRSYFNKYM